MKKAILLGFATIAILSDGTVKDLSTGKLLKAGKGKKFTLTATDDVPEGGIKAGNEYKWTYQELKDAADAGDIWEDYIPDAPATDGAVAPVVLTEEQKAEAERKAARKKLLDAEREAKQALIDAPIEADLADLKGKLNEAKQAIVDFDEANKPQLSEADKQLLANYEAQKEDFEFAKDIFEAQKEAFLASYELAKHITGVTKSGANAGTGTGTMSQRSPHLGYDVAQKIRKDYSVGRYGNAGEKEKASVIAKRYGCSPTSVMLKVNYLQHKLKRGDEAYTPLVNDFYNDHPMSGFPNGAPYEDENITENDQKCTLPAKRTKPSRTISA